MDIQPASPAPAPDLAEIWNAAMPPDLRISLRAAEYNTRPTPGVAQRAWFASPNGSRAGFVLASLMKDTTPIGRTAALGFIDAIAVRPEQQRKGLGGALLATAEAWLWEAGCSGVILGGSLRPFSAGLPTRLQNSEFFIRRGWVDRRDNVWDVARDLGDFEPPFGTFTPGFPHARVAGPEDAEALLAFFRRSFDGRWRFEFEEFLREGGRLSDYAIIETAPGRIDGFCQTTFEDSLRPLDRFFHGDLPKPWGQAGPLGVSDALRGTGLGYRVVNCGLAHLKSRGVRGCIIDWTDLVDFYAKFGFKPYREYVMLGKGVPI